VAFPDTAAVPTVVPPVVHVEGALDWGPNTLNVIVPVAPVPAPARVALIALVAMAVLVESVAGPEAEVVVVYCGVTGPTKPVVAVQDEC